LFDVLIKNGTIVDGSGAAGYKGDLAVRGGKIKMIEASIKAEAALTIDALGLVVAPGFIDIHRHFDAAIFRDGFGEAEIRQGITTVLGGNCGLSIMPLPQNRRDEILRYLRPIIGDLPKSINFESFSEYIEQAEQLSLPINIGMHIGSGTTRMAVMGFEKTSISDADFTSLHMHINEAIDAGAFGVSIGLQYMPDGKYTEDTLIKALKPMRGRGIPLVAHIRGEGDLLLKSLEEVITVSRALGVHLHISHLKAVGRRNWGHFPEKAINLLETARENGLKITCDMYPWTAGSTQLSQLLPPEFSEGGVAQTIARMKDADARKKCRKILESPQTYFENVLELVGWENIVITSAQSDKSIKFLGKSIHEIAGEKGIDPFECFFDLLAENECNVTIINYIASSKDIETIMKYPHSMIISDSIYQPGGQPHPRRYNTFPKVLAEYVREKKILTVEQAIHKFTGAPADLYKLRGKGILAAGFDADIVVFDPTRVNSAADYLNPETMATGFDHVFIGGKAANISDNFTGNLSGKLLRKK